MRPRRRAWKSPKCAPRWPERGVELAPAVMHQRKAFAARMQEGRTAPEIEPQGKAAAEVRELLLWVCDKVINVSMQQVTELPKGRAKG